jgi:hypothetical protein
MDDARRRQSVYLTSHRVECPLLSSTSKSQSLSHTRNPHAVCDNNLVFIKEGSELLGWFEFLGRIGKKVGREPDFRSARQLRVSLVSSAQ